MSETKLFEIRDSATFIPVAAVRLRNIGPEAPSTETWLLARGGWGMGDGPIHLFRLDERGQGFSDPCEWGPGARTMPVAHVYIRDHWPELVSGQVIDVEFILGLQPEPKTSERLTT